MEIDLASAGAFSEPNAPALRAEVCIVGGGIAGLLLAHRLTLDGVAVLLLEAGGRFSEAEDQRLPAEVEFARQLHRGTAEGRSRVLGGSSVNWGGQLLPLPDGAAWPVTEAELAPYVREAECLLGVDVLPYNGAAFWEAARESAPPLVSQLPGIVARLSKFAPFARRNLGASLGASLLRHPRARVALNAAVTELLLSPEGDRVQEVLVRARAGRVHRVAADHFVVAAGVVEACRLLLASRSVVRHGVGNRFDQVGRNFHDHLTVTAAWFEGPARQQVVSQLRPWLLQGVHGTVHALKCEASSPLCRELGLQPAVAHFAFEEPAGSGIAVLRDLLRIRQRGARISAREQMGRVPRAIREAAQLYREARHRHRRFVSERAEVSLRINVAQKTPSLSRVCLAEGRDAFGQPKAVVDWRIAEEDLESLRLFTRHLQRTLADCDCFLAGDIRWVPAWVSPSPLRELPEGVDDARHAMGGACLGSDPRHSVVDPQLRVHGMANLFVASTAVFPDGSPQLPTLTLMALSLRLASYLREQVAKRS